MGAIAIPASHQHMWQSAEVEFVDSQAVYRYECTCGATDFVFLA